MRIHISTSAPRKKPQAGDRRVTKKYGEEIRIPSLVHDSRGRAIGYDCTGGRQNYVWVTLDKLAPEYHYLLTKEEREKLGL